jgi:hypothetical protein
MGQKSEPAGYEQLFVLGLDNHGHPRGARFTMLRDSIVSAAMDMNCRVLIRQPAAVSELGMKLPIGSVFGCGMAVTLIIPNIGFDLYQEILEATHVAEIQEKMRFSAAMTMTVH